MIVVIYNLNILFLNLCFYTLVLEFLAQFFAIKKTSASHFAMCPTKDLERLNNEFDTRIKQDLKAYVLLTSNGIHYSEEAILRTVYQMKGYRCHKTVKYEQNTSHIIVRFEDEYDAREAVARINILNCGPTAVLLDDMLRAWFIYEIKTCPGPPCSLTIIDIVGNPPFNLNFLTSNILSSILKDFGSPYFLPYTAALSQPHMQFVFSSMTEALAACMVFGVWYRLEEKVDCFSYRVRINPSIKEENLIKKCGGTPLEAYKLEYFVALKKEIKIKRDNDSATKEKGSKTKTSVTKGIKKLSTHTQRFPPAKSSELQLINPSGHGPPILYVPIIATNGYNTLSSTCNQLGAEFTTALLNLQQTVTAQAVVAFPNAVTEIGNARQRLNSEEIGESRDSNKSEDLSISESRTRGSSRIRDVHRRARVFERRR